MIHEEKCYCAVCDNCQETMITYHDGYSLFPDKDRVKEAMDAEEWYTGGDPEHEGKHYCPSCFKPHPEEDDKIIVDQSRKKGTEMTRTAIYSLQDNALTEQPAMEKEVCLLGIYPCTVAGRKRCECQEYNEHLKSLRTIPVHSSARGLWKDKQTVVEGKDYEVKEIETGSRTVKDFNGTPYGYEKHLQFVAFPLPVKSEISIAHIGTGDIRESEEERVSWPGVLLEIHDKCRSHKNELGCQHPGLPSDEEFLRQLINELKSKYIITKR